MNYLNITEGIFIERPHRFGAMVNIGGTVEYVHVKNTGRCKELLLPGVRVFLEKSGNPARKTKYSLISVYKGNMLVNIDSQVPNKVVYDALKQGCIPGFEGINILKREVSYAKSRFDIYYETDSHTKGFIEVKGVTLDKAGTAMFPDAPTLRGTKHLMELAQAVKDGYKAHVLFLIQYSGANVFIPNSGTDPVFADSLRFAAAGGVEVIVYDSIVSENGIEIGKPVAMKLK